MQVSDRLEDPGVNVKWRSKWHIFLEVGDSSDEASREDCDAPFTPGTAKKCVGKVDLILGAPIRQVAYRTSPYPWIRGGAHLLCAPHDGEIAASHQHQLAAGGAMAATVKAGRVPHCQASGGVRLATSTRAFLSGRVRWLAKRP